MSGGSDTDGVWENLLIEDCENSIDIFSAGMLILDFSQPTITTCTFRNNRQIHSGGYGAGLCLITASPTVRACVFDGNVIGGDYSDGGAGAYCESGAPTFLFSRFVNNSVVNGFGAGLLSEGNSTVAGCTFADNSVTIDDGAATYGGGAIYAHSSISVQDCSFRRNSVKDDLGAPLGKGGALFLRKSQSVTNCEFLDNSAGLGGGAALVDVDGASHAAMLLNCTFVRNVAGDLGGGIFVQSQSANSSVIRNCIAWDNQSACDSSCTSGEASQIYVNNANPGATVSYSDIGAFSVSGPFDSGPHHDNIGDNPEFVDLDGFNNVEGDDDDNVRISS